MERWPPTKRGGAGARDCAGRSDGVRTEQALARDFYGALSRASLIPLAPRLGWRVSHLAPRPASSAATAPAATAAAIRDAARAAAPGAARPTAPERAPDRVAEGRGIGESHSRATREPPTPIRLPAADEGARLAGGCSRAGIHASARGRARRKCSRRAAAEPRRERDRPAANPAARCVRPTRRCIVVRPVCPPCRRISWRLGAAARPVQPAARPRPFRFPGQWQELHLAAFDAPHQQAIRRDNSTSRQLAPRHGGRGRRRWSSVA